METQRGYCCHCGNQVTLGAPAHGMPGRYYVLSSHICPVKCWRGRRTGTQPIIGILDTPPRQPPVEKKPRFKRPDKSRRSRYLFARSAKRWWILGDPLFE